MKRRVVLDGRAIEIEVRRAAGEVRFRIGGGEERVASVLQVQPGIYSVLLDGRSFEIKVVSGPDGLYLDTPDRHMPAQVIDPRDAPHGSAASAAAGRQNVTSPMPGRVVRVLVAEGDSVEKGQGLVVVEAMKMQNELQAPRAGTVAAIARREGEAVAAGEILVGIE